ncbi:MAG: gamma-glutamyltransferase [Pseudomonadota bacterium]
MIRFALALCLLASPVFGQSRANPEAASGWTPKEDVTAERHMIVAANPLASAAGLDVMRAGGSAADATIAALLVLNVVEPQSSGIGGGAFALVHGPDGLTSFDARETAPMAATPELFFRNGEKMGWLEAVPTGRSVGVPGLVKLMAELHERHGRLPWPALFQPAIQIAEQGFPVSRRLAGLVAGYQDWLADTDAARLFLPGGVPIAEGDLLRNRAFAWSLRRLALSGPEIFYNGALAQDMIRSVGSGEIPGQLAIEDFTRYEVIERRPACMTYFAFEVCGMGPPSSGATTVGQILGLVAATGEAPLGADGAHLFAEASRLAYADRAAYLGDPDFVDVPVKGLLDPIYLAERAALIPLDTASDGQAKAGDPPWHEGHWAPDHSPTSPGTTHLSVIDQQGLAISLTASIETAFGSKRMAGGFLLNNQLTDFSFSPVDETGTPIVNAPAAGKRPRSSMAPTIVLRDGEVFLLAGSPGGSRIPEYVAGSLISILSHGMTPAEAVAQGHISHRNRGKVVLEEGMSAELAQALELKGHTVEFSSLTSGLHLIEVMEDGTLLGGADPRREGVALGD